MSDPLATPGGASPHARLLRHTCSVDACYPEPHAAVNGAPDRPGGKLSPTVPPTVAADQALWPLWAHVPVGDLNYDAFDDDGRLLPGRGW